MTNEEAGKWRTILIHRLTDFDRKAEEKALKKGNRHNYYALAHYFEGVENTFKVLGQLDNLEIALRDGFTYNRFNNKFDLPPIEKVAKQYREWKETGKFPKL